MQQYNETVYSVDMVLGLPTDCQSNAPARAGPKAATTSSNSSSSRAAPTTLCHECSSGSSSSNSSIESCENKKEAAAQRGSRQKDLLEYNKFYSYPITQRIKLCVNNTWFEKKMSKSFSFYIVINTT